MRRARGCVRGSQELSSQSNVLLKTSHFAVVTQQLDGAPRAPSRLQRQHSESTFNRHPKPSRMRGSAAPRLRQPPRGALAPNQRHAAASHLPPSEPAAPPIASFNLRWKSFPRTGNSRHEDMPEGKAARAACEGAIQSRVVGVLFIIMMVETFLTPWHALCTLQGFTRGPAAPSWSKDCTCPNLRRQRPTTRIRRCREACGAKWSKSKNLRVCALGLTERAPCGRRRPPAAALAAQCSSWRPPCAAAAHKLPRGRRGRRRLVSVRP